VEHWQRRSSPEDGKETREISMHTVELRMNCIRAVRRRIMWHGDQAAPANERRAAVQGIYSRSWYEES
jgi:hypothetical protein